VEIDSLILDLEGRDYVLSVNAYEKLKRKCSQDWEAFKYLQERVHDVRICELSRGRNKMHEVASESRNKILTGYISCLAVATTAMGFRDLYRSFLQVRRQLLNAGALSTLFCWSDYNRWYDVCPREGIHSRAP
jgi:hypothetical protein